MHRQRMKYLGYARRLFHRHLEHLASPRGSGPLAVCFNCYALLWIDQSEHAIHKAKQGKFARVNRGMALTPI